MKKFICVSLVLLTAASSLFISGCEEDTKSKTTSSTVKKSSAVSTVPTKSGSKDKSAPSSKDLKEYLNSFTKGKNPIYGTWKIKGEKYLHYVFRNDGYAQTALGTEANFTSLSIDEDKKELTVSFIRGMNGTYSYKVSDNGKTLTLNSDKDKFTLTKQNSYSIVPKAPKKAKTDKKILGWWKDEGDNKYFFGRDGVMYSNNISMETGYTYNAEKGKIKAIYDYAGKIDIDFNYKYKNGSLYLDGTKFIKYSP